MSDKTFDKILNAVLYILAAMILYVGVSASLSVRQSNAARKLTELRTEIHKEIRDLNSVSEGISNRITTLVAEYDTLCSERTSACVAFWALTEEEQEAGRVLYDLNRAQNTIDRDENTAELAELTGAAKILVKFSKAAQRRLDS